MRDWLARVQERPRLVLSVMALLLASQIGPWWFPTPDACGYLSIARSAARGGPVTYLGSPKLHFPPGYPLLITPAFGISDHPFLLLSVVHWSLTVVFMLGVHRWSRRLFGGQGLWITLLVMVNVSVWMYFRRTLSEPAFMAVMIWTLEAMQLVLEAKSARAAVCWTLLAGLACTLLCVIRQAGVVFVAGFGAAALIQAFNRRIRWPRAIGATLGVGLPAALAIGVLLDYEARMARLSSSSHRTYFDYFDDPSLSVVDQCIEGVRLRVTEAGRLVVPGMFKSYGPPRDWWDINLAVYLPISAILLWGWRVLLHGDPDVLAMSVPFYLGLYIVFPFDQATRYLLPILPLIAACLWVAAVPLARRRPPVFAALIVVHLMVAVGNEVRDRSRIVAVHAQWPSVEEIAAAIRHDDRRVSAVDLDPATHLMLQFAVDRRIDLSQNHDQIDPEVHWIIMRADDGVPTGFVAYTRGQGIQLVARTADARRVEPNAGGSASQSGRMK